MKALKKIVVALFVLIGVLIVVGLFMPSKIEVERSRIIKAPVKMIYEQVNNLHLWEHWSPWHKIDPNMQLSYESYGVGKGASYSWTSEHRSVGNGKLTITEAKPFEFIQTVMDFGEQGTGTAAFKFEEVEEGVKVTWDMQSDVGKNPFMRLMSIVMKKSIESAYDRGLADIENQCEYLKENDWYYVNVKEKPALAYYGITSRDVTMENLESTMQDSYTKLGKAIGENSIEIKGSAFALYHTWGESFNMECGFPVDDNSKDLKGIEQKELPVQQYAILKYKGKYEGMESVHTYLMEYIKQCEFELAGPVMEKYKVGPNDEEDPKKWITYILYPIN